MARRTSIELTDDIDPTHTADETVKFGIDGVNYEIDLAAEHATQLRTSLTVWIDAARKIGKKTVHHKSSSESAAIREWARSEGIVVAPRGRIPADIITSYQQRHNIKTDAQRVEDAMGKAFAKVES